MTEPIDGYSEGPCSSCGVDALLHRGGLLGQPICPTCTLFHEIAPRAVAERKKLGDRRVTVEGRTIRLSGKRAVVLVAQQMVKKHRREEAEAQAALASSPEGA